MVYSESSPKLGQPHVIYLHRLGHESRQWRNVVALSSSPRHRLLHRTLTLASFSFTDGEISPSGSTAARVAAQALSTVNTTASCI